MIYVDRSTIMYHQKWSVLPKNAMGGGTDYIGIGAFVTFPALTLSTLQVTFKRKFIFTLSSLH